MLAIELPDEIDARLERLARKTGRSKADYVREAVLEHLDDLEDLYLAETRLEELRAGRTQTIPLEEVMKRHGLDS
jgi:RHH-type transcriptional regulator, rel operon repressor / antitoxin RelB